MPYYLDLSEVNPLLRSVQSIFTPAVTSQMLLYAGDKVGAAAQAAVQEDMYPPPSGNPLPLYYTRTRKDGTMYKSKFKSDKQQRYVMNLVSKGLVPYKVTGKLGQSITWAATMQGTHAVLVRVGSNLSYAPIVIDAEKQSFYHKGTWTPIQVSVQNAMPTLNKVAISAIKAFVEKKVKGNG